MIHPRNKSRISYYLPDSFIFKKSLTGANGRLERRVIDRKVKKGTEQAIQQYTESSDSVASFHRAAAKIETVAKKGNHTEVSKWILLLLLFFSLYLLLIIKKRLR